ncbi:glycosyltransferase [Xanthobacter sp. VNH20]|uniref:glycosyltransferase n=1 Tax=Xanthobacter sp. VNH20 TaxID=3156616 RepID=UPI0032B5FB2C
MSGALVQIVQRLAPGGIEVLALELARRLPGSNPVFSLDGSTQSLVDAWPALAQAGPVEGLAKAPGLRPRLVFALAARLRALKPRAVLVHHIGPLLYGGLAARLAGVPVLAYVEHDSWHYDAPQQRTLTAAMARLVRPQVVAVSQAVAEVSRAVMPRAPVRVIANAVDTERFRPAPRAAARARLGLPAAGALVGSAGRLEPVKGHDVLLRAMVAVPEARLALIGQGSAMEALRQLAGGLGIADRVHFLGHRGDMPEVLPALDLFCLPSRNEGLPLSVIEAQACDIPVVASDVGSLREAVCPASGRLVPAEDPPALAAAIRAALAAPAAVAPRAFVSAHFSWERMLEAYQDLMAGRAPC